MKAVPKIAALLLAYSYLISLPIAAAEKLVGQGASSEQTTVSGISSGGYMATQFHVAYSDIVIGAGIVAGGPYYCAASEPGENNVLTALYRCMDPCDSWPSFFRSWCELTWQPLVLIDGEEMVEYASSFAAKELIAPIANLSNDRVYLFSGEMDTTVIPAIVAENKNFYAGLGIADDALVYYRHPNAGHGFISPKGPVACDDTGEPFVNKCDDYNQAWEILNHLYGQNAELNPPANTTAGTTVAFNQAAFVPDDKFEASALADTAYAYVPTECETESCRIHVVFHGCKQAAAEYEVNEEYFTEVTGYNEIADTNRIIVLYPQLRARNTMNDIVKAPYNPRGCWDFWGYTGDSFYTRNGVQMRAIHDMVDQLTQQRL
ncbi:MAG: hypothetical protein V7752_15000 [Halopseudomonas sp.]